MHSDLHANFLLDEVVNQSFLGQYFTPQVGVGREEGGEENVVFPHEITLYVYHSQRSVNGQIRSGCDSCCLPGTAYRLDVQIHRRLKTT